MWLAQEGKEQKGVLKKGKKPPHPRMRRQPDREMLNYLKGGSGLGDGEGLEALTCDDILNNRTEVALGSESLKRLEKGGEGRAFSGQSTVCR